MSGPRGIDGAGGARGAGGASGPHRPKASPALKSLSKEVGQISTGNIADQGVATARYQRLNRNRGLPKSHERNPSAAKVRKMAAKTSTAADRVIY